MDPDAGGGWLGAAVAKAELPGGLPLESWPLAVALSAATVAAKGSKAGLPSLCGAGSPLTWLVSAFKALTGFSGSGANGLDCVLAALPSTLAAAAGAGVELASSAEG